MLEYLSWWNEKRKKNPRIKKYHEIFLFQIFSNVFQNNSQEYFSLDAHAKFSKRKKKEETFESFVYKYITWILIYDSNLWPVSRVMHILEAHIQQSPFVQYLFKSFFFSLLWYLVSRGISSWNASIVLAEKLGASG